MNDQSGGESHGTLAAQRTAKSISSLITTQS